MNYCDPGRGAGGREVHGADKYWDGGQFSVMSFGGRGRLVRGSVFLDQVAFGVGEGGSGPGT